MTIPKEIDNAECRAALQGIHDVGRMPLSEVLRGQYPIETGALLWHGLIEITGDVFSLTADGRETLTAWEAKGKV